MPICQFANLLICQWDFRIFENSWQKMDTRTFFELFIKELEINHELRNYYRLLNNESRFYWRKAYLEQRLQYINNNLGTASGKIWDAGCGFATVSIFLALNGHKVFANTIEFYYDFIRRRLDYWSRFGNLDSLEVEYSNVFDRPAMPEVYDSIVAQDTLHHLEPIHDAIKIFMASLKPGGRLIAAEENGRNGFIIGRNLFYRGFQRVTEYYDERLQKTVLLGNENARSLNSWRSILNKGGFDLAEDTVEFIRIFPPACFTGKNYYQVIEKEKKAGKKLLKLREFLFFGVNFTALKKPL